MIVVWTVAILTLLSGLVSATSPIATVDDEPIKGLRLAISATTERIRLPPHLGVIHVSVDGLARKIRLRMIKKEAVAAVAAHIAAHAGVLCSKVAVKDAGIELGCRSARIEAQITRDAKGSYLDINELRGLPWRPGDDAAPTYHYDPSRVGMGPGCPGHSEPAQGECEFKEGHALQAAIHFRKSLDTSGRQLACLRLGDLAMGIGDPLTATGWYRRAGVFGQFGRMAKGRICELDGNCLGSTEEVLRTYDAAGLPEPLRAETLMRAARAEAYAGRLPSAAHIIAQQVRKEGVASICREGGELVCRRILLEAMHAAGEVFAPTPTGSGPRVVPAGGGPPAGPKDGKPAQPGLRPRAPALDKEERDYLEELIETYLSIPSWEKGPLSVDMAQAAAPLVARLGAPAFAGNLLASLAPEVPQAQLAEHLLLAAEAFTAGQNWARARVINEYAQTRLGPKRMKTARWLAVQRTIAGQSDEDEESPALRAALDAELGKTLSDLKQARAVMTSVESLLKGARSAATGAKNNPPATAAREKEQKAEESKGTPDKKADPSGGVPSSGAGSTSGSSGGAHREKDAGDQKAKAQSQSNNSRPRPVTASNQAAKR